MTEIESNSATDASPGSTQADGQGLDDKPMTEVDRLAARYEAMGATLEHVSWGPEGFNMDAEQQAGILNGVLDQDDARNADTIAVPRAILHAAYEALRTCSKLGQVDIKEWLTMPEAEKNLRVKIRDFAEFPALHLSSYFPDRQTKGEAEE